MTDTNVVANCSTGGVKQVEVTQAEIDQRTADDLVFSATAPKLVIISQIKALESSITSRMIRENASGDTTIDPNTNMTSTQMIASINTQITALRAQLKALG